VHRLQMLPSLNQSIELLWLEPKEKSAAKHGAPTLVFLHEGLGSITQWRDFPQMLCDTTGLRGLVYARQGYGLSSLRATPAGSDFMHIEAQSVLPALLASINIEKPILVGHSDGGSIALLYAAWAQRLAQTKARSANQSASTSASAPSPEDAPGSDVASASNLAPTSEVESAPVQALALCVIAPHLFVEDVGVQSIAMARKLFDADRDFRERLGKHHRDVAHTFDNWATVWLSETFKAWNIEEDVKQITCPILAIQGLDDQYGSLAQIRRIAEVTGGASQVELLEIPDCKHSPHLERQEAVIDACKRFLSKRVHQD
jgi:pimeloyl-ACP methyl ester carboxylesterase